jgi:hypothetical protein
MAATDTSKGKTMKCRQTYTTDDQISLMDRVAPGKTGGITWTLHRAAMVGKIPAA